jgi:hypothetical protein
LKLKVQFLQVCDTYLIIEFKKIQMDMNIKSQYQYQYQYEYEYKV